MIGAQRREIACQAKIEPGAELLWAGLPLLRLQFYESYENLSAASIRHLTAF